MMIFFKRKFFCGLGSLLLLLAAGVASLVSSLCCKQKG